MAEMLILNPAPRRKARKTRSAAQKRATARMLAANRSRNPKRRAARRRSNPAPVVASARRVIRRPRRSNPVGARRRRNPIGSVGGKLGVKSLINMLRDAAIGGAGAVGVDVLMAKLNPHLPASMQVNPAKVGVGDAVKFGITALLGSVLSKPTRGLSQKMAMGAMTTQARDLISGMLPASMAVAGLAYASPAMTVRGNQRIGPIRNAQMGAYIRPGQTPMLNAYQRPGGQTALLSGRINARSREGSVR
jgi:hypothetical protein